MQPALCGWLSQAVALLEAQQELAMLGIAQCARGPEPGPEIREVLATTAWLFERFQRELESRIVELLGTREPVAPALVSWFEQARSAESKSTELANAAQATRSAWQQAMPGFDAHTRLVLRLQVAQFDAVIGPGLVAATTASGGAITAAEPLIRTLEEHLPVHPEHPGEFLSLAGLRAD
jgi:hypothetical protein